MSPSARYRRFRSERETHFDLNFFEHQQRARRRTALYLLLFIIAVAGVVVIANVIVLTVFFLLDDGATQLPFQAWVAQHPGILVWTTLLVLGVVGGAGVYRMAALAGGGGDVAQQLGATRLNASAPEPAHRVLLNVVEEMALAAGVPVPEVYVLEREDGINAFAAGFGVNDAAIAVTQGALVRLDREELQGVVAHEFSHILNGDMRLNTQLIGALYGIMAIGLMGRLILRGLYVTRSARVALVAVLPGIGLTAVGAIGLFGGRLIQAAVSRSREYLADASAVQFTRNPAGIGGALKKIAVTPFQGILRANIVDEISHMLIADGRKLFDQFFATHPPLLQRIRAIEPRFDPGELAQIKLRPVVIDGLSRSTQRRARDAWLPISPAFIVAGIGQLSDDQLEAAARLHAAIPDSVLRLAHSRAHAPSLLIALAMSRDPTERARQIARLRERLADRLYPHLDAVLDLTSKLPVAQRLPLVSLAAPAIRQHSAKDLDALVAAIEDLTRMDGRFDVLDYALVRLLRVQLTEVAAPPSAPDVFVPKLNALRNDVAVLFAVVARTGQRDKHPAHRAFDAGVRRLFGDPLPPYAPPEPWVAQLDHALSRLDRLGPRAKQSLIEALVTTVTHDRKINLGEMELLRAICASLHCPVPPMEMPVATAGARAGSPDAA
jgi:Zn-dependent protease with chaperone function